MAQPASPRLTSSRRRIQILGRPFTLVGAVALNLLIGLTGLVVGLGVQAPGLPRPDAASMWLFPFGLAIAIYGLLAVVAAAALWLRFRPAWALLLAIDLLGIAFLVFAAAAGGSGLVVGSGLGIWGVATILLVAPPTRRALQRRRDGREPAE